MQHFVQLAENLPVLPLLLAIRQQPHLWTRSFRTTFPNSPHREVLDMLLRVQNPARSQDHRECFFTPTWEALPQARPHVFGLLAMVEATRLGRILCTWMLPKTQIYRHSDIGPEGSGHYDTSPYWSRFHLVLESPREATFTCGEDDEETVRMPPGSLWWFNSALPHSVKNEGATDRLHLIVDLHRDIEMGG